ncbi:MAG TPA: AsmA-like C-terminal region-containing protein [Candidatus Binataceae bacterium]|nr:AsmA-like C-terminal region-containing protein [Candidatus Binataceae bacterium]
MHKFIRVGLIVVCILVAIVAAVGTYAVLNLNNIIQSRRELILAKASDALGRKVDVQDIHASLGWGVIADLRGLTVADDPNFSQTPFVQAADVYARVALLPLLSHRIDVEQISLKQPVVHVIRNQRGELNLSTIGRKPSEGGETARPQAAPSGAAGAQPLKSAPITQTAPQNPSGGAGSLGALGNISVSSLTIDNGTIDYKQAGVAPAVLSAVNMDAEHLGLATPIDINLSMAALGTGKNISLSGKLGPIASNGTIDQTAIPLALSLDLGPVTMADLKAVPELAGAIPAQLHLTNPVHATVKADGTTGALAFNFTTDLSGNRVVYTGVLDKAAGVPLTLTATGTRKDSGNGAQLEIGNATLVLGDLNLKAGRIQLGQNPSARLDSNRFDLAAMGKMLVALSKYNASGKAEVHANVKLVQKQPQVNGVITLASVTVAPPGKRAIVGGLSGDIKMNGNSAAAGPLDFNVGSGHARLTVNAQSIQPIDAAYRFSADVLKPAELTARPSPQNAGDHLNRLGVQGTVKGSVSAPTVTAAVASPDGTLQNVAYRNLAMDAIYAAPVLTINSLRLAAFNGTLDGNARATLAAEPAFNVGLNLHGIDLQQALQSQRSKAADIVRGQLTGQVRVAGQGTTFDRIKPTLSGNGQMSVANGKLVGVNLGAQALSKVQGLPGIDSLITPAIVTRHPSLFNSRDTDLTQLGMTFTIKGPRIVSHDIRAVTPDYSALADGWFDLDKNIDMNAHLLLSQELSREMMSAKKNIVYLANEQKQVDIPVRITGQLPKPSVQPDIQFLAQRAAGHLVQKQAGKLLNKYLGGGSSGNSGGNALGGALNKLFH